MAIAVAGLTIHAILFLALTAICAFDDGRLSHEWIDCIVPLGLLAIPLVLAATGSARRSSELLWKGSITAAVLGVLSLTGPGLFVLVPAILYGIAAARGLPMHEPTRRLLLISLVVVVLTLSGYIAVELITEPKDIDVSHCKTRWRDGRIISVHCPGALPG